MFMSGMDVSFNEFSLYSRLITLGPNLFIDTASASIDGAVLGSHDSLKSTLGLDVACKPRQLGDSDDNLGRE